MPKGTLTRMWNAVRQLNPAAATKEAEKYFTLAVAASSEDEIAAVRQYLLGPSPTQRECTCAIQRVKGYTVPLDAAAQADVTRADIVLATASAQTSLASTSAVAFDLAAPDQAVKDILDTQRGGELRIALASCFPPFRAEVTRRIVRDISKENAIFVITTALGDVMPSVFEPLFGVAEAAGDTVFLTANQVRMVFLIGAAYGEQVGYTTQWPEIASIMGAAFGWRAIARELVSKIPFGGGLVPKGAIAYAGTTVVGDGVLFYYNTGRRMTRSEMSQAFKCVYSDGLESARSLVGRLSGAAGALSGKGRGNGDMD